MDWDEKQGLTGKRVLNPRKQVFSCMTWKREHGDTKQMSSLYLRAPGEEMVSKFSFKAILMHNPVTFTSFRGSPSVEHQSLLHSYKCTSLWAMNLPVFPCSLPITSFSGSISSQPSRVLSISQTKEVPLFLYHLSFPCQHKSYGNQKLATVCVKMKV